MKEVKEIFLLAVCICIACGCGNQEEENGRYVETQVELLEATFAYGSFVQNQDQIRLIRNEGSDYLLEIKDGEISFIEDFVAEIPEELKIVGIAANSEGDRLIAWGDETEWGASLFTKTGDRIAVSNIGNTEILYPYTESGGRTLPYFFTSGEIRYRLAWKRGLRICKIAREKWRQILADFTIGTNGLRRFALQFRFRRFG